MFERQTEKVGIRNKIQCLKDVNWKAGLCFRSMLVVSLSLSESKVPGRTGSKTACAVELPWDKAVSSSASLNKLDKGKMKDDPRGRRWRENNTSVTVFLIEVICLL